MAAPKLNIGFEAAVVPFSFAALLASVAEDATGAAETVAEVVLRAPTSLNCG